MNEKEDWLKTFLEANEKTVKWVTILICIVVGLVLGIVLANSIFTDNSISIKIDLQNGIIEVKGGQVELPLGTIILENNKSYFLTVNGERIPLREFFESQGYKVEWLGNDTQQILIEK